MLNIKNEIENYNQVFYIEVRGSVPLAILSTPIEKTNAGVLYSYVIETQGEGNLSLTTFPDKDWISLHGDTLMGTPQNSDVGRFRVTLTYSNDEGSVEQEYLIAVSPSASIADKVFADVSVFPNPANDYVKISHLPAGARVSLMNTLGRIIYTSKSSSTELIIPTSNVVFGIYMLRIGDGVYEKTYKLAVDKNH